MPAQHLVPIAIGDSYYEVYAHHHPLLFDEGPACRSGQCRLSSVSHGTFAVNSIGRTALPLCYASDGPPIETRTLRDASIMLLSTIWRSALTRGAMMLEAEGIAEIGLKPINA